MPKKAERNRRKARRRKWRMNKIVKEINTTFRIEKIQKVKTNTKNKDTESYSLKAKDADGVGSILIKLPHDFDGFTVDSVIDLTISTSQTSLEDFEGWKETEAGKKETEAIVADKIARTRKKK